jgi:hypothetical protein
VLSSLDLMGAVLDAVDESSRRLTVRIDAITRDYSDIDGDVWLHRFSVLEAGTGHWVELCTPGPDGTKAGFPLAGRWTTDGRHLHGLPSDFTITCTSGAVAKCVRSGYKPWREFKGESLWNYHQACVRMLRADYGGDGTGHTRNGTLIEFYDRLGIQTSEPSSIAKNLQFEAAWGPDGAVCVRRPRIPEVLSVQELIERYPHLAGKTGSNCSETTDALIWNRS